LLSKPSTVAITLPLFGERMNRTKFVAACLVVISLSGIRAASAGDDVQVTVTDVGTPASTQKLNGNEATKGTIQLYYTVTDYAFPVGPFAQFKVNMKSVHLGGQNNAVYPAPLTLAQNGSQNVQLTPEQSEFSIAQLGWEGSSIVQIDIPAGVPHADGTELVANLNLSVPGANKVGTPTTIQVHILLEHPTACVKVHNFVTDADFNDILTFTDVNVKNGSVKSSQPGQFADNVLIANVCSEAVSFDLQVALDSRFETNPNNNPGNAVFAYATSGEVDPSTFAIQSFGTGQGRGRNLCLQNVTVPPNTSFLASIHSQVIKGQSTDALGLSPFSFGAAVRTVGANCAGALDPIASPNPVSTTLPFVVK
jgi:hypothetical protein